MTVLALAGAGFGALVLPASAPGPLSALSQPSLTPNLLLVRPLPYDSVEHVVDAAPGTEPSVSHQVLAVLAYLQSSS